jgi:hypothetical protein
MGMRFAPSKKSFETATQAIPHNYFMFEQAALYPNIGNPNIDTHCSILIYAGTFELAFTPHHAVKSNMVPHVLVP